MPRREETILPNIEYTTTAFDGEDKRLPIDRIVIHTTISTLNSAIATFSSPTAKTSAHYIVDLDGKLYQGLEEYYVAFHAGNYPINQRSIGIEHVDNGQYTAPRTDALYDTSSKLVADICKFYSIPCDRAHILKHNEIIATGCPHNLDIDRIIRQANQILNPISPCEIQLKEMTVKYEEKVKLEIFLRGEIEKKDKEIINYKKRLADIKALC